MAIRKPTKRTDQPPEYDLGSLPPSMRDKALEMADGDPDRIEVVGPEEVIIH